MPGPGSAEPIACDGARGRCAASTRLLLRSCAGFRCATEPDLVAVGVAVGHLAYTVGVGLTLHRIQAATGDLLDDCVQVIDENGVLSMSCVLGLVLDEDEAVLGKFPDRLAGRS